MMNLEPMIWKVVNKMSGRAIEGDELTEEILYYVQKNADEFHFYYANGNTAPKPFDPEIVGLDASENIQGIAEEDEAEILDPKKAELMLKSKEELLEIARSLGVKVHHASGKDKIIDAVLYGTE